MRVRKEGGLPGHGPFLGDGEVMLVEGAGGEVALYSGRGDGEPVRVGRGEAVVSADLVGAAERVAGTSYVAAETTLVVVEVDAYRTVAAGGDGETLATAKIGAVDPPDVTVARSYLYLLLGAGDQTVDLNTVQTMTFVVPKGQYYRVEVTAGSTLARWIEVVL